MPDQNITTNKTLHLSPIILNLPPKNSLTPIANINQHSTLYYSNINSQSILSTEVYLEKTQILSNLQIYQWRHSTQFPIPKIKYVRIEQNQNENKQAKLTIFHEYFPHSFTCIHQVSLSETLYLFRQCMIGLQILYSKFGGFEINQTMITINQKGFCKIWINENFALNSVQKISTQQNMVNSIKYIFKSRCQKSKTTKQLFLKLESRTTFLSCLIELESFINNQRMIVPCRYAFGCHQEPSKSFMTQVNSQKIITQTETQKHIHNYKVSCMKISEGETAYSRNNKQTSNSRTGAFGSFGQLGSKGQMYMDESYLSMEIEHEKIETNSKLGPQTSIKIHNQPNIIINSNTRSQNAFLNINYPKYDPHNQNIKHDQKSSEFIKTPRSKSEEEQEEEKIIKKQHTDNVMKNNGWNNCANILDVHSGLNESFNEGKEEVVKKEPIFFPKLDNIGRRSVAMSLLPEQYEDIV